MTIDLQLPAAACGDHHTAAGAGLPPGFRFHPTDEELLLHYLGKRAAAAPCPAPVIAEVDIYKYNPWELPAMAVFGESDGEWYFFSPRDRKYPNGVRPNRAAGSGYWKATGTDKPISISETQQTVLLGVKKALVFYRGRPPKGTKTSWIMHEYRLANAAASSSSSYTSNMKQLASSSSSSSSSASMRVRTCYGASANYIYIYPLPYTPSTDRYIYICAIIFMRVRSWTSGCCAESTRRRRPTSSCSTTST